LISAAGASVPQLTAR